MNTRFAITVVSAVLAMWSVGARAEARCTVSTAGGVNFGTYNVFSAVPLASTGALSLNCDPKDKNVQVTLSTGGSGSYTPRELSGPGGDVLSYNLFLDAAGTQIWGDGRGGTGFYSNGKPGGNVINLTVFGKVTAAQNVGAGSYSDTVTIEVNF